MYLVDRTRGFHPGQSYLVSILSVPIHLYDYFFQANINISMYKYYFMNSCSIYNWAWGAHIPAQFSNIIPVYIPRITLIEWNKLTCVMFSSKMSRLSDHLWLSFQEGYVRPSKRFEKLINIDLVFQDMD